MRRALVLLALLSALGLQACGVISPSGTSRGDPGTTGSTIPGPVDIDLSDPDLLTRLGSPPLEDIAWQRSVNGIELLGAQGSADPNELVQHLWSRTARKDEGVLSVGGVALPGAATVC